MNHVITISRQYGSGGREIGSLVAERLGIPFYDNALIQLAAEESGFSAEHFKDYDKHASNSFLYSLVRGFQYHQHTTGVWSLEDSIYMTQAKVIRSIAEKGPCVIIGRCADHILANEPSLVKVFVHAPLDFRAERVVETDGVAPDKAIEVIKNKDKRRQNYYNYHSDFKWGDAQNYNLCIDSSFCGIEKAASIICDFVTNK